MRAALIDAVIAALPLAVIFFSGWAYLSSYLGEFGIDATEVTVPLQTVLVYSFAPLKSWRVLLYLAFCMLCLLFVVNYARNTWSFDSVSASIMAIALVVLLFVVEGSATAAARTMANFVWTGHKAMSVPVLSKSPTDPAYVDLRQCLDKRRVRQIIGFPDRMYLLCRDEFLPCLRGRMFVVSASGTIMYSTLQSHQFRKGEAGCET